MAVRWEKVYIFISSTFNDMHAERDYLVKQVFPQLQEWCERRKLRLVDIDLRWGVTEADATQNKRVVQVCLERIDACRPFFLCFLGQRRGWVPGKDDISDETYANYPELAKYAGETSVTEMEILHALVNPLHQGKARPSTEPAERYERAKYAFFYLRQPDYLPDLPADLPQLRQVYTNEGLVDPAKREKADTELQHWRQVEIPRTQRPAHAYQARWQPAESTPEIRLPLQVPSSAERGNPAWQAAYASWARQWAAAGVRVGDNGEIGDPLEREKAEQYNARLSQGRLGNFACGETALAEAVIADLQNAIQERYPEHVERADLTPLQRELDQQEQFLQAASEGFIERQDDFTALDGYVKDDRQQLFVLTAAGGMGKTSLLARWIDRLKPDTATGESLHYRFIGASDGSTTVDGLLRSVLGELQQIAGKFSEEIPSDPNKLRMELVRLLESAGKKGKTIIVLDGLNQLESKLSDLAWLPLAMPANVRLVVSFKRGETQADNYYEMLRARGNVILSEVKPFESVDDRRQLVQVYLSQFLKELDQRHVEALIHSEGAANPLYLKVVLSELRVFGAFANLGEKIRADFGSDPVSAFQGVLKRLENDPAYSPVQPEILVPHLFAWLAHARQGLSVEELGGLLLQKGLLSNDTEGQRKASEAVYGLLRQVRAYLAWRDGQVDFFYESFRLAVSGRYVQKEGHEIAYPQARMEKEWHADLAGYFERLPGANCRRLYELPYQQTYANMWAELTHTLTDFDFLEAKSAASSVYDLEEDYLLGLRMWQGEASLKSILAAFEERLMLEAGRIHLAPEILFSQLYNHLTWLDAPDGPIHRLCEEAGGHRKGWLRSLQDPRPQPPWLHSFEGHTDAILALALTPDGRQIVSGSRDKTIKVWDLESGRMLRSLQNHTSAVHNVSVTLDGRQIVSASWDKTLKVWDLESGQLLRSLEGPFGAIAVAPDGRQIISGSADHTLKVWDLESGRLLRSLEGPFGYMAVTPDGRQVVSGSEDNTLKLWDMESGRLLRSLEGHMAGIYAVAFTPDGRKVISGSEDKTIKVWDLESGCLLRSMEDHTETVYAIAVTPDGRQVVSGAGDNTLKVWDLESGRLLRSMEGHTKDIYAVALTADGHQVVSGSLDNTIKVWNLDNGILLHSLEGHTEYIYAVVISPDGRKAVSGSGDRTIKVWEMGSGRLLHSLQGHTDSVFAVALTPDGQQIISGSGDKTIKVWELESGRLLRSLEGHSSGVSAVTVTPNGQHVVSGAWDNTLKVWDLKSGRLLRSLEGHNGYVSAVVVTPDGRKIVSASEDHTLKVWELESGRQLHSLEGHTLRVITVAITLDGLQVISGSADKTLKVWDLESGHLLRSLEGSFWVIANTPDGQHIVSCSEENNLKVWDLETGFLLHSLEGFTHSLSAIAVSPDGQQVVSGSWDKTLKVWDLKSARRLRSLEGHIVNVGSVTITPDRRKFVSASWDDTLKVWELESGRLLYSLGGQVNRMVATPDGRLIVSLGGDNPLKIWDLESGQLLRSLKGHSWMTAVAVTPDGRKFVSASNDNMLKVWDLESGRVLHTLKGYKWGVGAVAVTPDGRKVVTESNRTLKVYNLENGHLVGSLVDNTNQITAVAITPDGRQVIFASWDHTLKVWDLEGERLLHSLKGHTEIVNAVAFTSDGRQAISGSKDKTIRLWNLNANSSQILFWNNAPINCLALSTDGHYLCCGVETGGVWIFECMGEQYPDTTILPSEKTPETDKKIATSKQEKTNLISRLFSKRK